jgi:hypothetical protein
VGGVVTNGNTVSVSTVTQWVGAYQVNVAGPANLLFIYPSLSLSFTVDDPTNLGYSLDASTVLRGYLSTLYTSGPDLEQAIIASGTSLYASVDSGSGLAANLQITSFGDFITANSSNSSVNRLVNATGNTNIGNFTGTRNFSLVFTSNPSPAGTIVFQNDYTGEAAIRFGMSTTVPGLTLSTYPGADGEAASTHGHFLTVTATFNEANNAVPEPTTTALLGMGLVAIGAIARKRR